MKTSTTGSSSGIAITKVYKWPKLVLVAIAFLLGFGSGMLIFSPSSTPKPKPKLTLAQEMNKTWNTKPSKRLESYESVLKTIQNHIDLGSDKYNECYSSSQIELVRFIERKLDEDGFDVERLFVNSNCILVDLTDGH